MKREERGLITTSMWTHQLQMLHEACHSMAYTIQRISSITIPTRSVPEIYMELLLARQNLALGKSKLKEIESRLLEKSSTR